MRWSSFFILAYLVLGLWLGTGGFLAIGNATPNFVLLAAVFLCINAPRDTALLGVFLLGLFQDMLLVQPLGLYALSYGLAGMVVVGSRQIAYSDHPFTHFILALGGGIVVAFVMWIHGLIRPTLPAGVLENGDPVAAVRAGLGTLLLAALYTAALAPFVIGFLNKFKPFFGFRTARRRY